MISDRIDPPVRFREEPETGEEPGRGLTSRGLLVDNHVHTRFSGHCPEEADAVSIRWAGLGRGLRVSLREHAPLPDGFELRQVGGPSPEFPSVSRAVGLSLRDRSLGTFFWETAEAGLSVGFEVDILGGRLDLTEELVSALYREARAAGVTFDALNCSHHVLGEAPWDFTPQTLMAAISFCGGPATFTRRYFTDIREAVATGMFHCVSHIEAPRKFDAGPLALPEPAFTGVEEVWWDELLRTLETMAVHGVALEYNTGGLATWGRPYLTPEALRVARRLGLCLVVGSDAHRPGQIGRGFVDAERELRGAGVSEVWTFVAGRPIPVPLI
jgi:histidinol-phosphatase (PHP family)